MVALIWVNDIGSRVVWCNQNKVCIIPTMFIIAYNSSDIFKDYAVVDDYFIFNHY